MSMNGAEGNFDGPHAADPVGMDWSRLMTEQQYLRYLEGRIVRDNTTPEDRVAAYRVVCVQMLSILARYEDTPNFEKECPEYGRWQGELQSCTVGHVQQTRMNMMGGLYQIKVVGADGVSPALARYSNTANPQDREGVARDVRMNLFSAQECRFALLHLKLRRALSRLEWLRDDFAPLDPEMRTAIERIGGQRMPP